MTATRTPSRLLPLCARREWLPETGLPWLDELRDGHVSRVARRDGAVGELARVRRGFQDEDDSLDAAIESSAARDDSVPDLPAVTSEALRRVAIRRGERAVASTTEGLCAFVEATVEALHGRLQEAVALAQGDRARSGPAEEEEAARVGHLVAGVFASVDPRENIAQDVRRLRETRDG